VHDNYLALRALLIELVDEPPLTQKLRLLHDVLDQGLRRLLIELIEASLQRAQKRRVFLRASAAQRRILRGYLRDQLS
jgi:HEPN domain-containing protein